MEAYPLPYVEHNLPLVLLSGLGEGEARGVSSTAPKRQESGARISSDSPQCQTEYSQKVLQEFMNLDGTQNAWNAASLPGPTGRIRYRMKQIGRTYTLPPRKAAPLPQSPGEQGSPPPRNTELHSPLSPLSPGSPIFPDGLFSPLWMLKHQENIPALFLAFFNLNAFEASPQDDQLKSDINIIRSAISRSGFRTRLAVVLMSDKSILQAPELEERLASIRRATALDLKAGLFFMPLMSSQAEIGSFVQSMMASLQPSCIEYYRDLTKHARRKKARGGPLPPVHSTISGASQSLSSSGWSVRYEVKQGIFAEFRQEMDFAERHYSTAIEELFSSEGGVFEATASWNPRWDEARLLCDALALRVLRCQLWNGSTTGAAQSWQNYQLRMKDLVDRRGKGSNTYGWDAWESRWAGVMSQLIQMAQIPSLQNPVENENGQLSVQHAYAMPERPAAERLPPFNFLHHSGYWLRLVANRMRTRWEKAMAIPDEDRVPPGQSPASNVVHRSNNYDMYLVPEPHEESPYSRDNRIDHAAELAQIGLRAAEEFDSRQQRRISEQVRLDLAADLIRSKRYTDALKVLVDLWEDSSWRKDDWHVPFGRLLQLLSECANQDKSIQNATLIPALIWELLSVGPPLLPDGSLNIAQCLDTWEIEERLELRLQGKHRLSPIKIAFAFKDREGHVGELLECQFVLVYDTSKAAGSIQVSKLELNLGEKLIVIRHKPSTEKRTETASLSILPQPTELDDGTLETTADLTLEPSRMRAFSMPLLLREAHVFVLSELALHIETEKFMLIHHFDAESIRSSYNWYIDGDGEVDRVQLPHLDTKSIRILPKPPKMQALLHGLRKEYYTDERMRVGIELVNEEVGAVHATVVPKVIGHSGGTLALEWLDGQHDNSNDDNHLRSIEGMEASATSTLELAIQGPPNAGTFTLTFDVRYTLVLEPDAPLSKTVSVDLPFVTAFETKFTFTPQLHHDPWPSYFDSNADSDEQSDGVQQEWKLGVQISSLVSKPLRLHKLELDEHEGIREEPLLCTVHDSMVSKEQELLPGQKTFRDFELTAQKHSLDDRKPSYLDLSLAITWSRISSESVQGALITTNIIVPRLTIPISEPRVLCTVARDVSSQGDDQVTLRYHLENPSAHFLTFVLSMEASEEFAFCGPKYRTLSLAPLTRHCVDYRLLLHGEGEATAHTDTKTANAASKRGGTWIHPRLQVTDSYYQKHLRVHPAGPGVKVDERRELSVWVGMGEMPTST